MTKLYGWDTISLTDVRLVNEALARQANQLITEFDYKDEDAELSGRFGAWRIEPGGSFQQMTLSIPVASGTMSGFAGGADLGGVTLAFRVVLRLLEEAEAGDGRNLVFDLDTALLPDDGDDEDAVLPVKLIDPEGRLNRIQGRVLRKAVGACLSENSGKVSFVFASTKTRCQTTAAGLETPHHDWAILSLGDGRQYLGLLGSRAPHSEPPKGVDSTLVAPAASATVAISEGLMAERFILPSIQASFVPKAPFRVTGKTVQNRKDIHLDQIKKGLIKINPVITSMKIYPGKNQFCCDVNVSAPLPALAKFSVKMYIRMPLVFDAKTGKLGFKPDPNPAEEHTIKFPKALDWLIGWFVRWILGWFKKPIHEMIADIARRFQTMNTHVVQTVRWTGIRDFKIEHVEMKGAFVMQDRRPVETSDAP